MGHRANLIIVENREYSLYYSHWCANTIPRDLFWGPDHAISFVRIQRAVDETGWLDDVWAEGAAVIDRDNRVLLLYGGEDVLYDVPLRRVYLEMLQRVWAPWETRWAHEGIAEIADYVQYPRRNVLSERRQEATCSLSPPEQPDWTDLVGSFRLTDGTLQLYPLAGDVDFYLLAGPKLATEGRSLNGVGLLPLDQWIKDGFPSGGFHIDVAARNVDYWTAKVAPDLPGRVAAEWPDWDTTWHRDDYNRQLEATGGKLRFPVRPPELLQQQLTEMLLRDYGRDPVEAMLEITDLDRKEGKDVKINPWALRNDGLKLDVRERRRLVAVALDVKDTS